MSVNIISHSFASHNKVLDIKTVRFRQLIQISLIRVYWPSALLCMSIRPTWLWTLETKITP